MNPLLRLRWSLWAGIAVALLAACQRQPLPGPDVAARIGTAQVRYPEFETFLTRSVGGSVNALGGDVLSQLFDQFLDERLLVELAAEQKLIAPGSGPRAAIDALLLKEAERSAVEPAAVAAYYQAHRSEFSRPERVRLRQILTQDERTAVRAKAEVERGADFAEVARRLSLDASSAAGGYQGELARADLPPAFADLIFGLKPGAVSRVVRAEYGFHLFQVTERLPAEVVSAEQARDEIVARLRRERADGALRKLVESGRNRYNVEVYKRNLPFDYEGAYRDAQIER